MRTKKEKTVDVSGEKREPDENDYPHCELTVWGRPYVARKVARYVLAAIKAKSEEDIQAEQDRISRRLRKDEGWGTAFTHTDEDAIRATGMVVERNGQIDCFPDRSYPRD